MRGEGQEGCVSVGKAPSARWEVSDKVFGGFLAIGLVVVLLVVVLFLWMMFLGTS